MQLVSLEDTLHELWKHIFWRKEETYRQFVVLNLPAERKRLISMTFFVSTKNSEEYKNRRVGGAVDWLKSPVPIYLFLYSCLIIHLNKIKTSDQPF